MHIVVLSTAVVEVDTKGTNASLTHNQRLCNAALTHVEIPRPRDAIASPQFLQQTHYTHTMLFCLITSITVSSAYSQWAVDLSSVHLMRHAAANLLTFIGLPVTVTCLGACNPLCRAKQYFRTVATKFSPRGQQPSAKMKNK